MNTRLLPLTLAFASLGCGAIVSAVQTPGTDAPVVDAGAADVAPLGRRERCNGVDDDLDGRVDEGCPIRLTTDPFDDTAPTLSGTRVAWLRSDARGSSATAVLYVRDLAAPGERRLADRASFPAIAGDRVVFYQGDGCVLYDLGAGASAPVPHGDLGALTFRQRCVLGGDLVVWSETRDTMRDDYDVWSFDARTGDRRQLTAEPAEQWKPVTDGAIVAWLDSRRQVSPAWPESPTLFDVFAFDTAANGAPVNLTRFGDGANALAVGAVDAGRALVLERDGGPACALALYDVHTRARTELARDADLCADTPWALSGGFAVTEHDPSGVSDLRLYDLRGGPPRAVTTTARRSTNARLVWPWLVWADDRNDNWDLYAMDLTDYDRGDFSPEGVTP